MEAGSATSGRLPRGCVLCRRGAKMVLLMTGRCTTGCFYCPLSLEKKGKEVRYANERRCASDQDIVEEARLIGARGTGITGGDPLACLDETVRCIRLLKGEFGPRHHIHLYTSTIDPEAFRRLEKAGLDELRIHPRPESWARQDLPGLREFVRSTPMKVGFEVPALPGEEEGLKSLIRFAQETGMDFVNLNELEFSEGNWEQLRRRGYEVRDEVSSAIRDSEEMALRLVNMGWRIPVHYCSSRFKDSVQLRRRIMRRARRIARSSDVITEDGTLLKGVIEGPAEKVVAMLVEEFDVPDELIHLDKEKERIEVAPWVLEQIAAQLPYDSYLVEEYPTADRLEVERVPLRPR